MLAFIYRQTTSHKLLGLLLFAFFTCYAIAQSSSSMGSIQGVVVDPQGRPIPSAELVVRNTDFVTTRTLVTDDNGHFVATFLPAGPYSVQVMAPGFELKKPVRINVGANSSTNLELRMTIKATGQTVNVTGTGTTVEGNTVTTTVNRQDPVVANQVAGLTVTYLPNRHRDFTQYAQLAAAAEADPDSNGLVVAGQRPQSLKLSVDGADFNDPLHGGQRGQDDGSLFFPQVVVREFQVVHAGATAEVGGTNAGFINVVTKSGANKVRGEAFYIMRPAALTSSDAFGHSLDNWQNEFGGAIGGPIRKDRAFFYFGAEQDFVRVPYWTQFAPQFNGIVVPPSLAAQQRQIVSHSRPTALFGRTDFNLNSANTLNVQVNYNHVDSPDLNDGFTRTLATQQNQSNLTGNSVWVRGSLTSTLGPTRVNHLLAVFGRDQRSLVPNASTPEQFVNGFGVLGGNAFSSREFTADAVQFSNDFSLVRGNSMLSFGGFAGYTPANHTYIPFLNARFDFNSLPAFQANSIRRFRQTFITGDPAYDESVKSIAAYLSWKQAVTDTLTVTLGLRWEAQINPGSTPSLAGTQNIPNDLNQWQPRLGLAWSARRSTVVRLSSGLYDAATPATIWQDIFANNGINTRIVDSYFDPQVLPLVSSLSPLSAIPQNLITQSALVYGVSPNFRKPRSFQAAASIEQQMKKNVSLTLGYLHNGTWALQRLVNTNLFPPTTSLNGLPVFPSSRPNPAIGELLENLSNGHSSYDAFTATSIAQIGRRSQLTINYTLARSRDDGSQFDPFQPVPSLDPFNPRLDAAYSDFDIRHNFNVNAVFNLPKGFKVNPILLARSGAPYTPLVGFDNQNDGLDLNDRAIVNGQAVPRNLARQPAFANLDLRFVKDFTLHGEGHHLDLFLDVFNVTGASNLNFGPQPVSFFGTPANPLPTAGQALYAPASVRLGGARSVQFTARLVAF